MTLMVACLAPVDTYYEENLSTLEYASRAARITNQVRGEVMGSFAFNSGLMPALV